MQPTHTSLLGRFRSWAHNHHTTTLLLICFGVLLATATAAWAILYEAPKHAPTNTAVKKQTPTPSPLVFYSPLTGEKVPDQASTQQAVTAIMIENSPDARPQSGIKQAGVAYEAIAEGGITRFLLLYQEAKPQLIGPVRSLRLYYVDWLAPYQASVAHVGGSKFSLQEIRNGSYRDIDQFFNSAHYWRSRDRFAPHNVYTSFEQLDALNVKKGYGTSVFTPWPRKDDTPAKTKNATKINVTVSGPLYNPSYLYDPPSNSYKRFLAGKPHVDREAGQLLPKVVIVMDTNMTRVFEDGYRESISTIGTGRARIFQDGTVTEATWTKKDRGSQITFTDSSGKEVKLNRGQTWITAVPSNQRGGVSWQ